jgi:hypothetical protein
VGIEKLKTTSDAEKPGGVSSIMEGSVVSEQINSLEGQSHIFTYFLKSGSLIAKKGV